MKYVNGRYGFARGQNTAGIKPERLIKKQQDNTLEVFKNKILSMIALGNRFKAYWLVQTSPILNYRQRTVFCEKHFPEYV